MAEKEYIELGEAKRVIKANDWQNPAVPNVVNMILDRLPTADVVEVRHGEWKISESGAIYFCNRCAYFAMPREAREWKFCPHCGAKMDGGVNHGDA